MDPISAGLAIAGLVQSFMNRSAANRAAQQNLANQTLQLGQQQAIGTRALSDQQAALANALLAARGGQADTLRQAGGIRTDQFGNATYYDPNQGRWITLLTPQQRRLQTAEQAGRERTLARGAQAAEDYAQQRAGYLYRQPPSEAVIRDEITNLIQRARGEGERGLNTIMNRFAIRTAGNIPTIQQRDTGPSPGQQLAETMLQARNAALAESQSRERAQASRYLPAIAQFERTANVMPGEGPTGAQIAGAAAQGGQNILGALTNYQKLLPSIYATGAKGAESAYDLLSKGTTAAYTGTNYAGMDAARQAGTGPQLSQYASLINALRPRTTGTTRTAGVAPSFAPGTTFGTAEPTPWQNPDLEVPYEAAPLGGAPRPTYSYF